MRVLSLMFLVLVLAVGCGDSTDFDSVRSPSPGAEQVVLNSLVLPWNEESSAMQVSLDGHGFDRSEIHQVRVLCEGDCIMLDRVVISDGEFGSRTISATDALVDGIPIEAMRGDIQDIDFTAKGTMRGDLRIDVVADILK